MSGDAEVRAEAQRWSKAADEVSVVVDSFFLSSWQRRARKADADRARCRPPVMLRRS
jgi:hypothetical protein